MAPPNLYVISSNHIQYMHYLTRIGGHTLQYQVMRLLSLLINRCIILDNPQAQRVFRLGGFDLIGEYGLAEFTFEGLPKVSLSVEGLFDDLSAIEPFFKAF